MWHCQNVGKSINFSTILVGIQNVAHLTRCYSKISNILLKKYCHAYTLVANQTNPCLKFLPTALISMLEIAGLSWSYLLCAGELG